MRTLVPSLKTTKATLRALPTTSNKTPGKCNQKELGCEHGVFSGKVDDRRNYYGAFQNMSKHLETTSKIKNMKQFHPTRHVKTLRFTPITNKKTNLHNADLQASVVSSRTFKTCSQLPMLSHPKLESAGDNSFLRRWQTVKQCRVHHLNA